MGRAESFPGLFQLLEAVGRLGSCPSSVSRPATWAESSAHITVPSCPLPTHAITTATTTFTSRIREPPTQGLMAAFPPLCHVTPQVPGIRTWLSWGPLFCQLPLSGLCRFPALHRDLAEDTSHWEGLRPHPWAPGCWAKGGNLTRAQRAAPAPRGGRVLSSLCQITCVLVSHAAILTVRCGAQLLQGHVGLLGSVRI